MSMCCVVCTSTKVTIPRGTLEDQLGVFFFLEKLFPPQGDSINLEELLVSRGHPTEWVKFCSTCREGVVEGWKLFFQLTKCQKKLEELRTTIRRKVRHTWRSRSGFSELDEVVRKLIYVGEGGNEVEREIRTTKLSTLKEEPDSPQGWTEDIEYFNEVDDSFPVDCIIRPDGLLDETECDEEEATKDPRSEGGRRKTQVEKRKCPECGRVCGAPSAMIRHWNTKHIGKGPFTCPACNLVVKTKEDFFRHKKSHNDPRLLQPVPLNVAESTSFTTLINVDIDKRTVVKVEVDLDGSENHGEVLNHNQNEAKIFERPHQKSRENCDIDEDNKFDQRSKIDGRKKSKLKQRMCRMCRKVFRTPSAMVRHVHVVHHRKGPFVCPADGCAMRFTRKDFFFVHKKQHPNLRKHINDTLPPQDLRPPKEPKESKMSKKVPKQKPLRGNGKPGKPKSKIEFRTCPVCSAVFEKPSVMRKHVETRHQEGDCSSYCCEVCGRSFTTRAYLESHKWIHLTKEEKIQKAASVRKKRQKHQITDGDGTSPLEKRTCPICQEVFPTPSRMRIHKNVRHDKKRDFVCDVCGQGFLRSDTLRKHLKTHLTPEERLLMLSGDADNAEPQSVQNSSGLLKQCQGGRRKSRVEDRTCRVCQKIFDTPSSMQIHLKAVHSEGEKYICEVCGKVYAWKETLRNHMKYHEDEEFMSGAKNFTCSVCNVTFRHKFSYERHKLSKHSEGDSPLPFMCELCGKAFKIRSLLQQHMRSKDHAGHGVSVVASKQPKVPSTLTVTRFRSNVDLRQIHVNHVSGGSSNNRVGSWLDE